MYNYISSSKILLYICGFGPPHTKTKLKILRRNLQVISSQLNTSPDIVVNCYSYKCARDMRVFFSEYVGHKLFTNIWIHVVEGGVLAEMWLCNPYNYISVNYDQIIMILDDVLITHLQLNRFEKCKKTFNLDIISAKVINSSYRKLMQEFQRGESEKIDCPAEMFLYMMNADAFKRYISIQNVQNRWIWGIDFLLLHIGFKVGISKECTCKHLYKSHMDISKSKDMFIFLENHFPDKKLLVYRDLQKHT